MKLCNARSHWRWCALYNLYERWHKKCVWHLRWISRRKFQYFKGVVVFSIGTEEAWQTNMVIRANLRQSRWIWFCHKGTWKLFWLRLRDVNLFACCTWKVRSTLILELARSALGNRELNVRKSDFLGPWFRKFNQGFNPTSNAAPKSKFNPWGQTDFTEKTKDIGKGVFSVLIWKIVSDFRSDFDFGFKTQI